jgi:hypothetical protein
VLTPQLFEFVKKKHFETPYTMKEGGNMNRLMGTVKMWQP